MAFPKGQYAIKTPNGQIKGEPWVYKYHRLGPESIIRNPLFGSG